MVDQGQQENEKGQKEYPFGNNNYLEKKVYGARSFEGCRPVQKGRSVSLSQSRCIISERGSGHFPPENNEDRRTNCGKNSKTGANHLDEDG